MTTVYDICSCCRNEFIVRAGIIRVHTDHRGNKCAGSSRAPWVDVRAPWAEEAS